MKNGDILINKENGIEGKLKLEKKGYQIYGSYINLNNNRTRYKTEHSTLSEISKYWIKK